MFVPINPAKWVTGELLCEMSPAIPYCADVSQDLNNQMRPALQLQLLSMQKDWPDLDEDSGHLSPTCTKELPDPELLRRGKRRK